MGTFDMRNMKRNLGRTILSRFCNRVLRTLPSEDNFENESELPTELLRRRLLYVKRTIQPFLSAHSSQRNSSDGVVPKEKLCKLWVKTRKRPLKS